MRPQNCEALRVPGADNARPQPQISRTYPLHEDLRSYPRQILSGVAPPCPWPSLQVESLLQGRLADATASSQHASIRTSGVRAARL